MSANPIQIITRAMSKGTVYTDKGVYQLGHAGKGKSIRIDTIEDLSNTGNWNSCPKCKDKTFNKDKQFCWKCGFNYKQS